MDYYEREYSQRTLGSLLDDKAKLNKDKTYLFFGDLKISYQEINNISKRVANGFLSLGIGRGDKVAIMLNNCPEYLYTWFGLARLGAVDSAINTNYKGDGLKHLITISNAKAMVIDESFIDRIAFIQDNLPALKKIIIYSPEGREVKSNLNFPTLSFNTLISNSSEFTPPEKVEYYDPMSIIYTSGTTGPPKGVVLTHNSYYLYAVDRIRFLRYREDDILYNFLPLYHANHRMVTMVSLINNASYVMGERFSASKFWDEVRKFGVNCSPGIGGILYFLYKQPPRENDADNPLRFFFAGPIPRDIWLDFEKRFNVKIYCGFFGLTEASGVTWMSTEEQDRLKAEGKFDQAASLGREQKDIYEVKLVDDYDNEVPTGEVGEIVCRPSRPFSMFSEYFNMPGKTLEIFRNLYFHTGDLGKKDADGYFYFVDRKKDYIRRRGENISSFEIEKVVNSHPLVLESAAIGVKSDVGEDEVKIVVELKLGETLDPKELLDFCQERMAHYLVPRYVEFKEVPRTPTSRIEKYKLKSEGITPNTWDRESIGYKIKK